MYDLNLTPIRLRQGQPQETFSGFMAVAPPRRAVRSRAEDLMILSLTLHANGNLSEDLQADWLDRLSSAFFKTSGSVTSTLRSVIETLNLTIMEWNLKNVKGGMPVTGAINLTAIHRRSLYIAQSGLTHAYVLAHEGLKHFSDTGGTDRGLGVSRTPKIRYYQADLGTGGYLFMTDTPPGTWTEDLLLADGFPDVEKLRRRLLNQAPVDFRLDLVQIFPGEGQININQPAKKASPVEEVEVVEKQAETSQEELEPEPTQPEEEEVSPEIVPVEEAPVEDTREVFTQEPEPEPEVLQEEIEPEAEVEPQVEPETSPQAVVMDEDQTTAVLEEEEVPQEDKRSRARRMKEARQAERMRLAEQKDQIKEESLKGLAAGLKWWRNAQQSVETFFKDLLARWSPEGTKDAPALSRGTRLLIAVIVPLVLVGIAAGVYLARGKTQQYAFYFEQAQASAIIAQAAQDPDIARDEWSQVQAYLDQAEDFRETEELSRLRAEAQAAMDLLDGVRRLDYRPAIVGSLPAGINITNIVSYGLDLYLFDETAGRVLHAASGSSGYEIDPDFVCAAGNFSGGRVEALVDMAQLPINNAYQAHILGIDALGNVVYCSPEQDPVVQMLPGSEGIAGGAKNIVYESNRLYVHYPEANQLNVYSPSNGQFLDMPVDYFNGLDFTIRPDLSQVIDFAINGRELYLLRGDGSVVDCVYSGLPDAPIACENPVQYVDGRPGKEDQNMTLPDANYVSVYYSPPPDPSISILDSENADIYRFSLRFRLYQRLRPNLGNYEIVSPEATAFTIGIDQVAFIAFGNQVFYAYVQ